MPLLPDIEKAFLLIEINEKDQNDLRLLWYDNLDDLQHGIRPKSYDVTRAVFRVNCSPFLLTSTVKHHVLKYASRHSDTTEFS